MAFTLRFALKEDADLLVRMRLAYLREDHSDLTRAEEAKLKDRLDEYFPRATGGSLRAVLAFDDETVIGAACLVITEKPANPAFPTGKVGTILSVYTQPEYRRQGVATEMMKRLSEEGKKLDLSFIELSATAAGKPLYEKLGFVEKKSVYTSMKLEL